MKRTKKKQPSDYPTLTIRIPAEVLCRVKKIAKQTDLSCGQIVIQSLRRNLPDVEKVHGLMA